jgi:hypothetical protein
MISADSRRRLRATPGATVTRVPVNPCALDALLCDGDANPRGHRGVWFYHPDAIGGPAPAPGGIVEFVLANDAVRPVARGRVVACVRPDDYPKACSGVNDRGFTWEDV